MYGVVTRNAEELAWSEFDRAFFEAKDVTGRAAAPEAGGVNMVSLFGDNAAVESDTDLAARSADGEPATRERPYFDWDYVCPTDERYREGLREVVADCLAASEDLRLDDVGFPRAEYCHCDRCDRRFAASDHDDRAAWRTSVVTDFVADLAATVPGRTYLTVYPDPYPGHLQARSGVALEALAAHVDEFVVPIYDMHYGTTYWLEALASGFADRLATPFGVELYAVNVDLDALVHAAEVADAVADHVYFGYDAGQAAAAIRRIRAEQRDGETHRPD